MRNELRRRCTGFVGRLLLGVLLFTLFDSAIFRSGAYFSLIDPNSSTGTLAQVMANAGHANRTASTVLVMGDSRIAEGFSAKAASAEALAAGHAIGFINGAVPGTTPRVWYYMLRRMLHTGKPAAVVMMTTTYHDNETETLSARATDIVFVHPLLQFSDLVAFPSSFPSAADKVSAAEAILLSGYYYKNDVSRLIENPALRVETVTAWNEHGSMWLDDYPGHIESLKGATLDLSSGAVSLPPDAPSGKTARLASYAAELRAAAGRPPENQSSRDYRSLWFGRIATLCEAAGIPLYVLRIPRGPFHFMITQDDATTGSLAVLQRAGRLNLLPAPLFDNLERPEYFFDELHLNATGRVLFSRSLASAMLQRLTGPE
nr:hypothetical protein [uncultured Rhodopila sp.]